LPAEHDYIGTDVVKSLYPKPPPKGTHFQDQSIKEPFPSEWQETFEVVHQRLVMAAAAPKQTPGFIVQNLVKLLKPVGWLQLVEVITTPVPENPIPRNQHIDMLDSLYKNLYSGTKYAKANLMADLPWEMEKSGLRNVQQAEVLVKYGAATENLWIREKSLRTAVAGVPNFLTVLKGVYRLVYIFYMILMIIETQKCLEMCGNKSGMIFHSDIMDFTRIWLKVEVT
jgi:hypothetical protein